MKNKNQRKALGRLLYSWLGGAHFAALNMPGSTFCLEANVFQENPYIMNRLSVELFVSLFPSEYDSSHIWLCSRLQAEPQPHSCLSYCTFEGIMSLWDDSLERLPSVLGVCVTCNLDGPFGTLDPAWDFGKRVKCERCFPTICTAAELLYASLYFSARLSWIKQWEQLARPPDVLPLPLGTAGMPLCPMVKGWCHTHSILYDQGLFTLSNFAYKGLLVHMKLSRIEWEVVRLWALVLNANLP